MSRKSKRRRNRFDPATGNAGVESAAFEFVDDRSGGATAADFVVTGGAAAESQPAPVHASAPGPHAETRAVATPPASAADVALAAAALVAPVEAPRPATPVVPQRTLGEVLASAREARGLTLEEASARTRISTPTLRNLEGDRFDEMAAAAYARGFLRSYGSYLRLDVGKLLQQYEAMVGQHVEAAPDVWEQAAGRPARTTPKWAAWVAAAMGIAVVAGGVVYGVRTRQDAPLGAGAGLQQIEDELRAAQTVTPAPAPTAAPAGGATSVETPLSSDTANSTPAAVVTPIEDTVAPEMPAVQTQPSNSTRTTTIVAAKTVRPGIADRVEEPAPISSTNTIVKASEPGTTPAMVVAEAVPAPTDGLVLTVTARDSCALRLQIDADARHAQRYAFAQPGETHSWSARRSFRLLVQRSEHLDVRLNGKLMRVPDGRTLVLDRESLSPAARPARRTRRPRAATTTHTPPPASTSAAPTPTGLPPHAGGGPPPR